MVDSHQLLGARDRDAGNTIQATSQRGGSKPSFVFDNLKPFQGNAASHQPDAIRFKSPTMGFIKLSKFTR